MYTLQNRQPIVIKTDISNAARKFRTPHKVITIILGYTKLILCFMDPAGSLFISQIKI